MDRYTLEEHPFSDFILNDTEKLIIGTFPTAKRNRQFNFYYAGSTNHFWSIMEEVFNVHFLNTTEKTAIEERKDFAKKNKIGFTDMLEVCNRKNESSVDEALYPIKIKDITSILKSNPSIKALVFTSRTEAIGALGLFKTHLYLNNQKIKGLDKFKNIIDGYILIEDRQIDVLVPYSPSNRSVSTNGLEEVTKMYGYVLNDWEL